MIKHALVVKQWSGAVSQAWFSVGAVCFCDEDGDGGGGGGKPRLDGWSFAGVAFCCMPRLLLLYLLPTTLIIIMPYLYTLAFLNLNTLALCII